MHGLLLWVPWCCGVGAILTTLTFLVCALIFYRPRGGDLHGGF